MALETHVTNRYSAQLIKELTNPQNASAASNDAVRLTKAADDVKADFEIYAGITYDDTNSKHINIAVEGVIVKLRIRTAQSGGVVDSDSEKWIERLRALAQVTSRDRISPKSSSELTPSDEVQGSEEVRPDFDRQVMADYTPSQPRQRQASDEI